MGWLGDDREDLSIGVSLAAVRTVVRSESDRFGASGAEIEPQQKNHMALGAWGAGA